MRIEVLYEYMVVAHYLNFSSAALNLHISQPNLSKHISDLENELGVELLKRGKTLQLTAAGTAFLEDSIQIHHKYKDSLQRCREIAAKTIEELTIQEPYIIDAMSEILYKAIMHFKAENPYITVKLATERGKKSVESLMNDRLDIALTVDCNNKDWVEKKNNKKGLIFIPILEEPFVIWLHNKHPLIKKENITLEDLTDHTIIMTAARSFDPIRFAVLDMFHSINISPNLKSYSVETLNEFFMNTHDKSAIFLVTPTVARSQLLQMQSDMTYIPMNDHRARITSYIVIKEDYQKKSLDVFIDTIEKISKNEIVHDDESVYIPDVHHKVVNKDMD